MSTRTIPRGSHPTPPDVERARDRRLVTLLPQVAGTAGYAAVGGATLWGTASAHALFDAIEQAVGLGPWLRSVVGIAALVAALTLLDVDTAGIASVALSAISLGAVAVLAVALEPAAGVTIALVVVALLATTLPIAWTRREELRPLGSALWLALSRSRVPAPSAPAPVDRRLQAAAVRRRAPRIRVRDARAARTTLGAAVSADGAEDRHAR